MTDHKEPIFNKILNLNSPDARKNLIAFIEKHLGGKVICYVENLGHPFSYIGPEDVHHFEDLLHSVSDSKKGFLILNSSGGNADVAEKLIFMCRERFPDDFTIIVPNFAKSAATMMCLGADKIMMGYLAELGPIDPQISIPGNAPLPARSFIDSLEMIKDNVQKGDPLEMYFPMLKNIKPEIVSICKSATENAECLANNWLSKYMLKDDPDHAKKVATWLSDGQTYKSHGKVINYLEAKNILKLNVEKMDPDSDLWSYVWELYIRLMMQMRAMGPSAAKIFESLDTSLTMNINTNTQ